MSVSVSATKHNDVNPEKRMEEGGMETHKHTVMCKYFSQIIASCDEYGRD